MEEEKEKRKKEREKREREREYATDEVRIASYRVKDIKGKRIDW